MATWIRGTSRLRARQRWRLAIPSRPLRKKPADFAAFLVMGGVWLSVKPGGRRGVVPRAGRNKSPGSGHPPSARALTPRTSGRLSPGSGPSRSSPKTRRPRSGRWGLSLTFKSAWPRARARLMNGGRKSKQI